MLYDYRFAEVDTAKAYSLFDIGLYYNDRKIDSALYYYQLCEGWIERSIRRNPELINRSGFRAMHCAVYSRLGKAHFRLGQSSRAIDRYKQGLMLAMQYKDTLLMGDLYNGLANIYDRTGNRGKAAEYCIKGLKLLEKTKHYETLIASYHNLALLFLAQGERKQALAYLNKSLKKAEEHDYTLGVGVVKRALAMYYYKGDQLDSALSCTNQSIDALRGNPSLVRLSDAYTMLAKIQLARGEYQAGLNAALESYNLSKRTNHLAGITQAALTVSRAYEKLGNDKAALSYLKESRVYAESADKQKSLTATLERNMRLKAAEETTADSIAHAQQMKIYQDRLAIQREKVRENNIAFYGLLAGIGLLVVLAVSILFSIRYKKKAETILKTQAERSRALQKNTLDSINYAKRIQTAILPKEEVMKEYFDDAFVLWSPKETVGGVIALFEHHNNRSTLLLLDTQTEGVPGALLSLLSSTLGKRAFKSAKDLSAKTVWEEVKRDLQELVSELNVRSENLLAVCLDHDSLQLDAAGNSAYLSVHSAEGLNTLFSSETEEFQQASILLNKGDTIQMGSQGVLQLLDSATQMPQSPKDQKEMFTKTLEGIFRNEDIMIIGLQV